MNWKLLTLSLLCCIDYAHAQSTTSTKTVSIATDEGTWMSLDVSPDGRTIAFNLLGQLLTMPIEGGKARQLTEGPAFNEWPQFTADGQFLVYTSDRGGANELWRIPVSGGVPQRVPAAEAGQFHFLQDRARALEVFGYTGFDAAKAAKAAVYRTPDGRYRLTKRNAFVDAGGDYRTCTPSVFMLTDETTGATRRLASAGEDCGGTMLPESAFTPDGRAFITAYGGKIRRIAIADGQLREIPFRATVRLPVRFVAKPSLRVPQDPLVHARRITGAVLSPDGSRAAFSAFSRIWTASLSRPKPKRLTDLDAGEFWPAWSPDGQYVAFVSWMDGAAPEGAVYRMRADGKGRPERLTTEPGMYFGLTYSGDGSQLCAFRRPERVPEEERSERFLRYLGSSILAKPYEVVCLPAGGGAVHVLDVRDVEGQYGYQEWLAGLHAAPRHSGGVEGFVRYERKADDDNQGIGGLVLSFSGVAAVRPLLDLICPMPLCQDPWDVLNLTNLVISPTRDRALVVMKGRELYLIDIPSALAATQPPAVTFDPTAAGVQRITTLDSGAEFPRWQPDGKSFSYTFGSTLYTVDVPATGRAAPPRAVKLDVTMPRDLPTGILALRNARLITMRGDEVIEKGDLLIRDRRIVAIGPAGTVAIPEGVHVVDLSGKTVIPGLIDLHDHMMTSAVVTRSRVMQFEAALAYGALTVRDPQASNPAPFSYEDVLDTGDLLGPRYMNTGPGIGPCCSGDVIASPNEARQVIARYADMYRVGSVKDYELERRDARQWLSAAAAERGIGVTTHSAHIHMIKALVENVVDGYGGHEHLWFIGAPLRRDIRQLLAVSDLTLSHLHFTRYHQEMEIVLSQEDRDRARQIYPPVIYERLIESRADNGNRWSDSFTPLYSIDTETAWRTTAQSLAQTALDGGKVGLGSHGNQPGLGAHLEMRSLAAGGMTPQEVLRAATLTGAQALHLDRDLGSLEVGKLGDVLILDKNPLENVSNSTSIRFIVFNGRLREALTLDEVWPRPRKIPPVWWREKLPVP